MPLIHVTPFPNRSAWHRTLVRYPKLDEIAKNENGMFPNIHNGAKWGVLKYYIEHPEFTGIGHNHPPVCHCLIYTKSRNSRKHLIRKSVRRIHTSNLSEPSSFLHSHPSLKPLPKPGGTVRPNPNPSYP